MGSFGGHSFCRCSVQCDCRAFNVLQVYTTGQHGLVAVVRYFNSSTGLHLYSTSIEENILAADETWIREGVVSCAFDPLI